MVSDLEPTFQASPALRGALSREVDHGDDRSTILHRLFAGGSLKIVASKAPRNLRRHTARVLFVDEADAMEPSARGCADPACRKAHAELCRSQDRRRIDAADRGDLRRTALLRGQRSKGVRGPVPELWRLYRGALAAHRVGARASRDSSVPLSALPELDRGAPQAGDGRGRPLASDKARGLKSSWLSAERARQPARQCLVGQARGGVPAGEARSGDAATVHQYGSRAGLARRRVRHRRERSSPPAPSRSRSTPSRPRSWC